MELKLNYTTDEIVEMLTNAFDRCDEEDGEDFICDENGEITASRREILNHIIAVLRENDLWEFDIPFQMALFDIDTQWEIADLICKNVYNL